MTTLDLSVLTDDQLVELVRVTCAEAASRNGAVGAAIRDAMLSEAERRIIADQAAERELQRLREQEAQRVAEQAAARIRAQQLNKAEAEQARTWEQKRTHARRIGELLANAQVWSLTVWQARDSRTEKRVYLDLGVPDPKVPERYFPTEKITLWVTGNSRHAPGSLTVERVGKGDLKTVVPSDRGPLQSLLAEIAQAWNSVRLSSDLASSTDGAA